MGPFTNNLIFAQERHDILSTPLLGYIQPKDVLMPLIGVGAVVGIGAAGAGMFFLALPLQLAALIGIGGFIVAAVLFAFATKTQLPRALLTGGSSSAL